MKMKRLTAILAVLLCAALTVPCTALADAASGGEYNYQEADFYVVVDAPDYYVNFRYGPGMEYGIKYPIYNGEILHVTATSDNYYDGLWWGQVDYNGDWGWISISQTSMIDDPYVQPETPAPAPAPEPTTAAPQPTTAAPEPAAQASAQSADFSGQEDQSGADVIHGVRNTGYLAEDAYYCESGNQYYAIPVIGLNSEEILNLNKEIYRAQYPLIQEGLTNVTDVERLLNTNYYWSVNGDLLSLVISNSYGGPWYENGVYVISIPEQKILAPNEVVSQAGWTWDEYQQKASELMEQSFHDRNDQALAVASPEARDQYDQLLAQTLDPENVADASPFLDGDGHLCILCKINLFQAQLSYTWAELDLTNDAAETEKPYYVRVGAPGGTTFLRKDAGLAGQSLLPIFNGQKLRITETVTDPQGSLSWGKTAYNGQHGWILLDDTIH